MQNGSLFKSFVAERYISRSKISKKERGKEI
jgi:hypothetical protein